MAKPDFTINLTPANTIGYTCKYTPIELFRSFGVNPVLIDGEETNFQRAEELTHANVCSHAKALIQQASAYPQVVLTDCCDSIRRVHDVLEFENTHNYLCLLDLPHETNGCAIDRFTQELIDLTRSYETYCGIPWNREAFVAACRAQHDDTDTLTEMVEPFYAVLGARISPELLTYMKDNLAFPVINLTCSGNRHLEVMPSELANASLEELMNWYAGALLRMVPCMRMTDISGRRTLTEHPYLKGIIYNTVKFCDFYGFDYENLRTLTDVPLLKIESDFTPMPQGQLATRLEAFEESLAYSPTHALAKAPTHALTPSTPQTKVLAQTVQTVQTVQATKTTQAVHTVQAIHTVQATQIAQAVQGARPMAENATATLNPNGTYLAGIDSGSTTTNMIALDQTGEIVARAIVRTGAKAQNGARAAFQEIQKQLGATPEDFKAITATGYGRFNIPFATDTKTEITCHAKGAHFLNPEIRTIVDIGGQDSKVICLDETGAVSNFIMNDKCAAGTGRFLEAMARTLEIDLSTLSVAGLTWDKDISISSMCTVFAESEVISLIADNHSESDIAHGINKSIASRTASMVSRAKGTAPFMMTGGVARNRGVVEELERKLDASLFIADNPDLCGALGAALFALEEN